MSIVLVSALSMASINYLPWWQGTVKNYESLIEKGFPTLERAYDISIRAANGVVPDVRAAVDGGASEIFNPVIGFLPAAPPGMRWSYGKNQMDGTPVEGLNYFCLSSKTITAGDKVMWKAAKKTAYLFSADQYFINTSCGATSNISTPTEFPGELAMTMYVKYVPGMAK